jgi:hypothetical protein
MSGWQSIPKPYLVVYLALSAILNFLGIASIVEGIVTWAGFLEDAVNVYHQFLRDPILRTVMHFWPAAWPKVPSWTIDLLIIQSSFFISYRLFMAFEKKRFMMPRRLRILQPVLVFLGGPLVPFIQITRLLVKAARESRDVEIETELAVRSPHETFSPEGWLAMEKRKSAAQEAMMVAKSTRF